MEELFITKININKVRHLKDIEIPLSGTERKHLILTGKNGSGKTSVLEEMKKFISDASIRPYTQGHLDKIYYNLLLNINDFSTFHQKSQRGDFIISYFPAVRTLKFKEPEGPKKVDLKSRYSTDDSASKDFVQYIVNLKANRSFAKDENDDDTAKQIDEWFEKFENSLKMIFDDETLILEFDKKNYNYNIIQKNHEKFDFNSLADGYSAILNIVTELIMRMENKSSRFYDIQGIVLIDEIETHLHVDMQKKILPFLVSFFPKIQFIVTTHSPFVCSSLENAIVYDLERKILVSDLDKYSYKAIVESYFSTDGYSEELKNKLIKFEELSNKVQLENNEIVEYKLLSEYFSSVPNFLSEELNIKLNQIKLSSKRTND